MGCGSSLNVVQGSSLCEMRPSRRYHLCCSEELQSIDMKRTKMNGERLARSEHFPWVGYLPNGRQF